jgi:uncharacterized membrane protein YeaQ/YmgE (transglycosylase-associated protein family)
MLFGAIVGAAIHLFDSHRVRGGIFSTVLVGMVGAVVGGIGATILFNTPVFEGVLSDARIATTIVVLFFSILVADMFRAIFTKIRHRRNRKMRLSK